MFCFFVCGFRTVSNRISNVPQGIIENNRSIDDNPMQLDHFSASIATISYDTPPSLKGMNLGVLWWRRG